MLFLNLLTIFGLNFIIILIFNTKFVENQCGDINPPRGGFTSRNGNHAGCVSVTVGFECIFSCKTGCTLNLPDRIVCQNTGWVPSAPPMTATCIPNDCPPRSIPNGNTCGPTRVDSSCTFICNPGYRISGQPTFQCQFIDLPRECQSQWDSSSLPVCIQNPCSDLFQPNNGYLTGNCQGVSIGQECRVSCNPGFSMVPNNPVIQCTTNGWNPSSVVPICQQQRCPELFPRDNLIFIDSNLCRSGSPGSRCQFNCPPGYSLSPNINYLECNSNGQWSGQLPSCVSFCSPEILQPINGFREGICQSPGVGQECRVSCSSGYVLTPNTPIIQCTSVGWNPSLIPVCQQIRCPELFPRDNLIFIDSNLCRSASPGTRCQLSCPLGYSLSPNIDYLECNNNGQWSGQLPSCVRICSPDISQPINGFREGICQSPGVGQECRVSCSSGYVLTPNTPIIQCTSVGWNPSIIPVCQQIRCPELFPRDNLIFLDSNQCRYGSPGSRCQFSCPNGYYLTPNINELDCDSNGQWSNFGQLPRCQSIQCESVNIPENGRTTGECISSVTKLNSVCTILCNQGCLLSDNTDTMELRCIGQSLNGGWDRPTPTQCLRPQICDQTNIEFATSCPPTPVGQTCTVSCLQGYRQSGNNVLRCVENIQSSNQEICLNPFWSPSPINQAICTRVLCPDIALPTGQYQGTCTNPGADDVCTWICGPGYRNPLNNGNQMTARCQSNGEWDGPTQCVQISCPSLQPPIDGTYTDPTCNPGTPGQQCYFSCYNRFTLDPPTLTSITCQSDGSWSNGGFVPRCVPMADCPNVQIPLLAKTTGHCVTTAENRVRVGSICTILCYDGCYLNDGTSDMEIQCIEFNGITQWNKAIPSTCLQQMQCLPFGPIEFGSACDSANVGQTCALVCNTGYTLVGNDIFTCILPNNPIPETCVVPQWSFPPGTGSLPVCQLGGCPSLEPPQDGAFTPDTCAPGIPGQNCEFLCNAGFILEPPNRAVLTCQPNGQWTQGGQPPVCSPLLCEDISGTVIQNGGINVDDSCASRRVGAVCNFFCSNRFILNGEVSTQCMEDGQWSNVVPTCDLQIIECEGLPDVVNANKEGHCNPGRSGDRCTYVCLDGFELMGQDEFLCQHDKTWDGTQLPSCGAPVTEPATVNCPDLGNPENGEASGDCTPGIGGQTCTFTCADTFELVGAPTLTCGDDGNWDAEPPTCPPVGAVQCDPITQPSPDITLSGNCDPALPDQKCTLSCTTNPSQVLEVTCQPDGQWSGPIDDFTCEPEPVKPGCPPVHLPNGAKSIRFCSPGRLGRRCEMGCGKGYKISGKNSMLCTMNGKWIGKPARCLRQCKAIPARNGRLSGTCSPTGLQNSYCSLRCNSGFNLVGPRTTMCGSTGLWTPTIPRCLRQLTDCG